MAAVAPDRRRAVRAHRLPSAPRDQARFRRSRARRCRRHSTNRVRGRSRARHFHHPRAPAPAGSAARRPDGRAPRRAAGSAARTARGRPASAARARRSPFRPGLGAAEAGVRAARGDRRPHRHPHRHFRRRHRPAREDAGDHLPAGRCDCAGWGKAEPRGDRALHGGRGDAVGARRRSGASRAARIVSPARPVMALRAGRADGRCRRSPRCRSPS